MTRCTGVKGTSSLSKSSVYPVALLASKIYHKGDICLTNLISNVMCTFSSNVKQSNNTQLKTGLQFNLIVYKSCLANHKTSHGVYISYKDDRIQTTSPNQI